MVIKKHIVFSIIVILTATCLFGQSTFLQELKKKVVENDLQIQRLQAEMERIDYEIDATRHQYSPELNFNYKRNFLEYMEDEIGDERTRSRSSLTLQQDLTTTFVTTPAEVDKKKNEKARLADRIEELVRRREAGVMDEYLKLLILKQQAEAYSLLDSISSKKFDKIKRRYYFGEVRRDDFVKSSRDIEKINSRKNDYSSQFETTLDLFAAKYGLISNDIPFEPYATYHTLPPFEALLDSLYSYYNTRGERQLKYAEAIDKYRYNSLRDISLTVYGGYNWYEYGAGDTRDNLEAGVRINFPLSLLTFPDHNRRLRQTSLRFTEIDNHERLEENIDDLISMYGDCESKSKDIDYLRIEMDIALERLKIASIRTEDWKSWDEHKAQLDFQQAKIEYEIGRMQLERSIMSLAYATFLPLSIFEKRQASFDENLTNAVWVWNSEEILSAGKTRDFVQSCIRNKINRVFFSFSITVMSRLDSNSGDLLNLIRELHRNKIQISALLSENTWLMPSKRQSMGQRIDKIIKYNAVAKDDEKIDGIHFDIEPQGLEVWDTDKITAIRMLFDTMQYVKRMIGGQTRIELDLAPYIDEVDHVFLKNIAPYVDEVTLMAYQQSLEDILIKVYDEMSDSEELGLPIIVGIDVNKFDDKDQMQESAEMLRNKLSIFSSFRGMAFHDYNNLIHIRVRNDEFEKKRQ